MTFYMQIRREAANTMHKIIHQKSKFQSHQKKAEKGGKNNINKIKSPKMERFEFLDL